MTLPVTPSQTTGPFFAVGLCWPDGPDVVPEGTPGAVRIGGRVTDGAGDPVPDALVETWQADPQGRFTIPTTRAARRGGRASPGSGGSAAARPTPRDAGRSAPSSRAHFPPRRAAPRRRIWMCRCSPGGCCTGW
jgi:protocatechuate 3,4-dioxygenase, alpha subunit